MRAKTAYIGAMLEFGILKQSLGTGAEAERWWRRAADAGDLRGLQRCPAHR